ncbi:pig-Q [Savitreella phatthalungensis]
MREPSTSRELLRVRQGADRTPDRRVTACNVKVFWPADLLDSHDDALILGWHNSPTDLFVIDLVSNVYRTGLEQPVDLDGLVTKYANSQVSQFCGKQPLSILGQAFSSTTSFVAASEHMLFCRFTNNNIYPSFCLKDSKAAVQLIIFERPDPHRMQYFSLAPIPFEVDANSDKINGDDFAVLRSDKTHGGPLIGLSKLHLNQMNCSREVAMVLQRNLPQLGSRRARNRAQSFHDVVRKSASSTIARFSATISYAFHDSAWPALKNGVAFILSLVVSLLGYWSSLLRTELPLIGIALVELSVLARELDFRLQRIRGWPEDYATLRRRKKDWASITNYHPDYIKFYNGLWLIANDLIIGIYVVSICHTNEDILADALYGFIENFTLDTVSRAMWWLKGWPAGLKLNNELATFLGDLFLWLLGTWRGALTAAYPHFPWIIRSVGICGFLGASISVALISDCLSLLTLHLHLFYHACAKVYGWQVSALVSLFHLFRGKKRNVLRHRIDSNDYDLDQLLLGTVLFTLLVFLFPTVLVFYVTFAIARIAIRFLRTALDMVLAFLVQLPLFGLLLRIKDAKRLPGGLRFSRLDVPPPEKSSFKGKAAMSIVYIEPKPLPIDVMFAAFAARQRSIMGSTINLARLFSDTVQGTL